MPIQFITKSFTCFLIIACIGCGSNWRIHEQQQLPLSAMSNDKAPDWVKGFLPINDDRVYFVGRSHTPDQPLIAGMPQRTPDRRTGFTVLDEREAAQSARDDVYDQIRQRLAPRNMGNSSNLIVNNIDSGTCTTCGDIIAFQRTDVTICNNNCNHIKGNCNAKNIEVVSPNGTGTYCGECHTTIAQCAGCSTIVHAVTQLNRKADHLASNVVPMARDLNVMNINVDSIMPSLGAYLIEEEVYFEKWWIHDGDDTASRPFAHGRDEWQSYKCWMLCSMPTTEFHDIAEDFRDKYEEQYEIALQRSEEDRERRIAEEVVRRQITRDREEEEREWNREDEEITRAHTIEINKDRETIPGRRFTLEKD